MAEETATGVTSASGALFGQPRTMKGLQRFMVPFVELSPRRVQLGGVAKCPNGIRMGQAGLRSKVCVPLITSCNHFVPADGTLSVTDYRY